MSAPHVGPRLRLLRRSRNLTLSEVARRAGCSESMVSKIETTRVNPSLTLVRRLAGALDLNVAALFDNDADRAVVARNGRRPRLNDDTLRSGDGVILERLVAQNGETLLQANIHIVLPGGASDGAITHFGEEMGYLLEGELELVVDDETFQLKPGDSFHFRSERPHSYRNLGESVARVLWVNTPPTF